jgi:hypothetical protein
MGVKLATAAMNARGVDPDSQYAILAALAATDPAAVQDDAPTPPRQAEHHAAPVAEHHAAPAVHHAPMQHERPQAPQPHRPTRR